MADADPRAPTRRELARAFNEDFRQIKAFEKIFDIIPDDLTNAFEELQEIINNGIFPSIGSLNGEVFEQGKTIRDNRQLISSLEGISSSDRSRVFDILSRLITWRGDWEAGYYLKNDQVSNNGGTYLANQVTDEEPGPLPLGEASWTIEDSPSWATNSNSVQIFSGLQFTIPAGRAFIIDRYRFWVPDVSSTYRYSIWVVDPNEENSFALIGTFPGDSLDLGWNVFETSSSFLLPGSTYQIVLQTENNSASTTITGGWKRGANGTGAPANEGWNRANNQQSLRIDDEDLDSVFRRTELLTITAGSSLQFVDVTEANRSVTYEVLADAVGQTGYVEYSVSKTGEGPFGEPLVGNDTTLTATVPTPASSDYVELANGYLSNDNIDGLLSLTGSFDDASINDNAYGIDVEFQEYTISDQWDTIALGYTEISAVSGGGARVGSASRIYTEIDSSDSPYNASDGEYIRADMSLGGDIDIVLPSRGLVGVSRDGSGGDKLTLVGTVNGKVDPTINNNGTGIVVVRIGDEYRQF